MKLNTGRLCSSTKDLELCLKNPLVSSSSTHPDSSEHTHTHTNTAVRFSLSGNGRDWEEVWECWKWRRRGCQWEERWKVATSGQYRPHAMGRNACVFIGEWKSKGKEERRRRKEAQREGSKAEAAAWLCVWMKEPLSLSHSLLLSVRLCARLTSAAASEHMSRANTARLSKWLPAGSKYFAEAVAEGATFKEAGLLLWNVTPVFFAPRKLFGGRNYHAMDFELQ